LRLRNRPARTLFIDELLPHKKENRNSHQEVRKNQPRQGLMPGKDADQPLRPTLPMRRDENEQRYATVSLFPDNQPIPSLVVNRLLDPGEFRVHRQ